MPLRSSRARRRSSPRGSVPAGAVTEAKLFMNGRSQAVRLPAAYRFAGDAVYVKRWRGAVILLPKTDPWKPLVESVGRFSADFLRDREQPAGSDTRPGLDGSVRLIRHDSTGSSRVSARHERVRHVDSTADRGSGSGAASSYATRGDRGWRVDLDGRGTRVWRGQESTASRQSVSARSVLDAAPDLALRRRGRSRLWLHTKLARGPRHWHRPDRYTARRPGPQPRRRYGDQ